MQYNYCIAINLMRFLPKGSFRLIVRLSCGVCYYSLLLDILWDLLTSSRVSIRALQWYGYCYHFGVIAKRYVSVDRQVNVFSAVERTNINDVAIHNRLPGGFTVWRIQFSVYVSCVRSAARSRSWQKTARSAGSRAIRMFPGWKEVCVPGVRPVSTCFTITSGSSRQ